jgi:hypothetical protein
VAADSDQHDGLISVHNHEFMGNARLVNAYERRVVATGHDYQ